MRHDICPHCRKDIRDNMEEYCPNCGALVTLTGREMKSQQLAQYYGQAETAMHQEEWREVAQKLIDVLSIDPEYRDAWELLSQARLEQQLINYNNRAQRYREKKRWDKATQCYNKILQLRPGDEDATAGLRQIDQEQIEEKQSTRERFKKNTEPVMKYLLIFLLLIFSLLVIIAIIALAIGMWV